MIKRTKKAATPTRALKDYQSRRNFNLTSEPKGSTSASGRPRDNLRFVIQKHQASHLHYDFRLEWGGVLLSWAIPKGPSLDPADKRIAVHVEDHPLDYADFQGTIPDGQYGAGKVETWDRGIWEPLDDPDRGMRKGELKFILHGGRLNGRFTLVRLKPKPRRSPKKR